MRLKLMIFSVVCGLALWSPYLAFADARGESGESESALSVVVSVHPLQLLIEDLTKGVVPVQVTTLMSINASPHDFSLSPQQMRQLREADWVLWLGAEAEPYLAAAVRQHAGRALALLQLDGVIVRHSGDDHAHVEPPDHGHHHQHAGLDPHLWWQLDNLLLMAEHWVAVAVQHRPAWTARLTQRLSEWRAGLETQRAGMRAAVEHREVRALSYHDAFGYLFDDLGLVAPNAVMPSPDAKPGVRQVMQLRQHILERHWLCFLVEPASQPQWLSLIDPEATLIRVMIDPLGWDVPDRSQSRISALFGQAYQKLRPCVYPALTTSE